MQFVRRAADPGEAVGPSRWVTLGVRLAGLGGVALLLTSAPASYLVRTATALGAAGVLLAAAAHLPRGGRLALRLFAAALLVGALSGLTSAGYTLVTGEPSPTGWVADWIYLAYAPLAVAGTLALPRPPGHGLGRLRALSDGVIGAGSLAYLISALVVEPHHLGADLPLTARVVTLAYPLAPAFVLAVMLSALPRVGAAARGFLVRATVGMAVLGIADMAFAVAAWGGWYQPTSWVAALNQLGLLLFLDAALVGCRTWVRAPAERATTATVSPWWLLAQYLPLVLALVTIGADLLAGRGIPAARLPGVLLVGVAVFVRQVTEAHRTHRLVDRLARGEATARREARSDALTGLANRLEFLDRLDAALADPYAHPVAVAMLDLNDFKDINDTHGHDTGDEVLRRTADRLLDAVPDGVVARLGGDEFAAFAPATRDGGHGLGATLAGAFDDEVLVGSRPFVVRPSVGVVMDERPVGGARTGDAAHLLAHADVAMYEAKATKTQQVAPVAVLTGAARASAAATIAIREEVSAPDLAQFSVVYQPVVNLFDGEIRAVEALLRWKHPRYGDVSPGVFIPLAERVGSVTVLGDHVVRTALADLARWEDASGTQITVGVNVSPRQLTDPALADVLVRRLAEHRLAPGRLGLEVTEEALVDDIDAVADTVAALRRAGINVAVDDFGTGYSSLRYLRRFDANIVKIDQEFVQAAPDEARTDALVGTVVRMAESLGLICVAEGIETLEQLALVRGHGCHLGQGYLLARPMPAEAVQRLLVAGHHYPVAVATEVTDHERGGAVVPLRRARS